MSDVFVASGTIDINTNKAIVAFNEVDKKAKETTETLNNTSNKSKSWADKFSSLGNKLTLGVTAPLGAAGIASFNLASDLNENINKTDVVFKNNSKTVMDWSKNAITNMGMCQSSALEMASKFGDMGSSMGLTSDQTKTYSMNLTQLAADLASFKNISIERANDALTGVYTGETESLKGLGIVMTQTNLQQFAQSKGIKKKIQDMTQAEQVQLRYNYVMSKTKDAQGDFARTGDEAANAGRKFKEATKELGATIGNNLLPIFTPLINTANEVLINFSHMSEGTQQLIVKLGLFAVALGPAIKFTGNFTKAINGTTKFIKNLPGNITKTITSINNFGTGVKNGTNALGKLTKSIVSSTKAIVKFTVELIKSAVKGIGNFVKNILNGIKTLVKFTLELIKNTAMAVKNGAVWVANKVKLLAYKTAQVAVTIATKSMTLAQKALNLAMKANPIGIVITLLLSLATVFVTLYNKCEWFRTGVNKVWSVITNIFTKFDNFLTGIFTTDWTKSFGAFGNIMNAFMSNVSNIWNSIKRIFGGVIDFVSGVFTGNWSKAWQGVVNIFGGIMDGLGAVLKAPLNAVIGMINMAIGGINSISVDIPDWVPFVGGEHFGVNLPTLNYLYNGGIFTKPTLLGGGNVVGDKFKGTGSNAEAVIPLNILWNKLDAIANRPIIVKINERELITIIAEKDKEINKMKKQLGII